MKNSKENEKLLAMLVAEVRELKAQVSRLGQVKNPKSASSEECLYFNFKRIHKKEVYQAFLDIYARGGIEMSNQELIAFLAHHTNLGSEASITTLFYRYKQHVHV